MWVGGRMGVMRMREFLFRGKRCDNGEWVEGFLLKECNYATCSWNLAIEFKTDRFGKFAYDVAQIIPETVGQFTGLTDKNGKKIFEGDIVKCRHTLVKFCLDDIEKTNPRRSYGKEMVETDSYAFKCVYWRNYAVSFRDGCIRIQNGSDHHGVCENYIYNHKIEVIGNIHDNPELLGGDEDGK